LILKYFSTSDFFISSRYEPSLIKIKKINSNIKTGIIIKEPKIGKLASNKFFPLFPFSSSFSKPLFSGFSVFSRFSSDFPKEKIIDSKADFIVSDYNIADNDFLKNAEKLNKKVFVWSVNDEQMINKFLSDKRVKGIITDRPDLVYSVSAAQ